MLTDHPSERTDHNAVDHQSLMEQTVVGDITDVVFRSPDGQYAVLNIVNDQGQNHTVIGNLPELAPGRRIAATGLWETHRSYGRQFRVREYQEVLPATEEGIQRYLASGILPGIGPKLAERIVKRFGAETLTVLDRYSGRLTEIPGLGKQRIERIREAWHTHSQRRESYIFFQGLGISQAYCNRIMNRYGDEAPAVVRANPYRLAQEVKGVGFKMADAVALKQNIAKDNPFRLAAGIVYVVEQLVEQKGHCYVPRESLIAKAAEVLSVDEASTLVGIQRAIADGTIIEDHTRNDQARTLIYPSHLFHAESNLARVLMAKLRLRPESPPDIAGRTTDRWSSLNSKQQEAVRTAFREPISIITGGPGVGKTTVTREIVAIAHSLNLRILLAAPTGRAAKRLGEFGESRASTIHRLLRWQPEQQSFAHNIDHPLDADLIVIDEVSMLDVVLANHLFAAVPAHTGVVLVGDRDQLPSIGPGAVLQDLIRSGRIKTTHLTEIYRQTEHSQIIVNAHRVNEGKMPRRSGAAGEITDFYWIEQDDQTKVIDIIRRMVAERIPERFQLAPMTDIQVLTPLNRGLCGTRNLNRELQNVLNPTTGTLLGQVRIGEVEFRVGDRVMQISNNYDVGVFNGDLGTVRDVSDEHKACKIRFDNSTVTYGFEDMDQLRLAYAITIHKSQGSEFPAVIVPVLSEHFIMLRRNLIYTAMTRAKKLLVMVGSTKALAIAVENFRQSPRYTRLATRIADVKRIS